MLPDRRQQTEIWAILKDTPLVRKWPQFRTVVLPNSDLVEYKPGDFIFRRGDAPRNLFIVVTGRVLMRLQEGGDVWYEQELRPGDVFGQQALWDEAYRTTSRVPMRGDPATVLQIDAGMLRVALERVPDLREELLHEGRAGRLRRIPLFRSFSDDQVRWLAQLIEEEDVKAGEDIPLATVPGIWVVDQGQLAVTGPLNPFPVDWPTWRITAGNFLVAVGDPAQSADLKAMQFGLSRAAETACATVKTHLFYLPAIHADRIINQFGDVRELIQQPAGIVAALDHADLFRNLSPLQKQHLAQFTAWEFVPEKQNITTQGDPGQGYVVLRDGGALITAYDNYGRERPRTHLKPRAFYGRTSLLEGSRHEVTVRAVRGESVRGGEPGLAGADVVTLDRRDFVHAIAERPDLWRGNPLAHQVLATKDVKQTYDWMQEGEVLKWHSQPHRLWLMWPLGLIVVALLVLALILILLPPELTGVGEVTLVIVGGFLVLVAIAVLVNYFDDYYAITNRRVTRRDRQFLLFEARGEAPIEMVQDVTINSGFWGRVFDYGDITIRTASKGGAIMLDNVPQPERVKEILETTRTEAQADERGRQKEDLRRGLIKDLRLALPVAPRQRALGDVPPPISGRAPAWLRGLQQRPPAKQRVPTRPSTQAWLAQHSSRLPESWRKTLVGKTPPTQPKELPGMMMWRKHWLNAVKRVGGPVAIFLAVFVLGLLLLLGVFGDLPINNVGLFLGWLALLAVIGGWVSWEWVDYRNDVYIVTDDRIIDIEMQPFGLNAKRREGGLEKVQNVVAKQDGVWAKIFDYGDVLVSTAAADEGFTFNMVAKPQLVQSMVFQKLDQFRAHAARRAAAQRQQELVEALSVYHQLRGGGTQADSYS